MTRLTNIQQVLSNVSSVEKIQQVQQHQAQMEQSRLIAQNQKTAENRGKKIEDPEPSDKVEIRVKDGQKRMAREDGGKEKGDKEEEESGNDIKHIDIRV